MFLLSFLFLCPRGKKETEPLLVIKLVSRDKAMSLDDALEKECFKGVICVVFDSSEKLWVLLLWGCENHSKVCWLTRCTLVRP